MKNSNLLIYFVLLRTIPTANAFDLPQAWQAARTHSADFRAAEFNRDAQIELEQQAKAGLLPQISANSSYSYQPPSLSSTKTTRNFNIQLNQTLYDGTKWSQYRQTKLGSYAAESQLRSQHDETMLKVSESYFNVLLAKDTINAVTAEREAYREQLRQAKEMYERGAATAVDIHEAQAGFDSAVAKEIDALTQKQMAENELSDLTGYDSVEIAPIDMRNLVQRIELKVKQYSLAQWQNLAIEHNQAYQTQKFNSEMAQEGVKTAKTLRHPKLSANVGYQHSQYRGSQYSQDYEYKGKGASVSLQLSIPLYSGGEIRSKIREAAARLGEEEAKLLSAERKIKLSVKQAFTENNATHYQILAQERLLASNQLKLKSTRTGKDFGVRSNVEVIQAQKELADSEQKLAQARYRYLLSFLTLLKESGMDMDAAWANAFAQINPTTRNTGKSFNQLKKSKPRAAEKSVKPKKWRNRRSLITFRLPAKG